MILDEPTNHLDVDSREALVQALNSYSGAVVIVSHDRHMIELVADRLVLVDGGLAQEFNGTLEDYTDFVLAKGPSGTTTKTDKKAERRAAAEPRERVRTLQSEAAQREKARKHVVTGQRVYVSVHFGGRGT